MIFRKGQKSLEMVIGMVILLVVAGTVIGVFLDQFDETPGSKFDNELDMQSIERQCESFCDDFSKKTGIQGRAAAVEYCTKRFVSDITGDGTTNDLAGTLYNSYCENGIRCFNIHQCDVGREVLDAERCAEVMENYYTSDKIGLDQDEAGNRIAEWFQPDTADGDKGIGTCGLENKQELTWWNATYQKYQ